MEVNLQALHTQQDSTNTGSLQASSLRTQKAPEKDVVSRAFSHGTSAGGIRRRSPWRHETIEGEGSSLSLQKKEIGVWTQAFKKSITSTNSSSPISYRNSAFYLEKLQQLILQYLKQNTSEGLNVLSQLLWYIDTDLSLTIASQHTDPNEKVKSFLEAAAKVIKADSELAGRLLDMVSEELELKKKIRETFSKRWSGLMLLLFPPENRESNLLLAFEKEMSLPEHEDREKEGMISVYLERVESMLPIYLEAASKLNFYHPRIAIRIFEKIRDIIASKTEECFVKIKPRLLNVLLIKICYLMKQIASEFPEELSKFLNFVENTYLLLEEEEKKNFPIDSIRGYEPTEARLRLEQALTSPLEDSQKCERIENVLRVYRQLDREVLDTCIVVARSLNQASSKVSCLLKIAGKLENREQAQELLEEILRIIKEAPSSAFDQKCDGWLVKEMKDFLQALIEQEPNKKKDLLNIIRTGLYQIPPEKRFLLEEVFKEFDIEGKKKAFQKAIERVTNENKNLGDVFCEMLEFDPIFALNTVKGKAINLQPDLQPDPLSRSHTSKVECFMNQPSSVFYESCEQLYPILGSFSPEIQIAICVQVLRGFQNEADQKLIKTKLGSLAEEVKAYVPNNPIKV